MQKEMNLFSLVGLPFDPPKLDQKRTLKRITEVLSVKKNELMHSTGYTERASLKKCIEYLQRAYEELGSLDKNEFVKRIKELSEKYIELLSEQVERTASTILSSEIRIVYDSALNHVSRKTGLSIERIKTIFESKGLYVVPNAVIKALPQAPINIARIDEEFALLQNTDNPNPNDLSTSFIDNLYSLAAYLSGDSENYATYREMGTKELWGLFFSASRRYCSRNDDYGRLLSSLSTRANSYVFDSEDNRRDYDNHIGYYDETMQELLDSLKFVPKSLLYKPAFANECIEKIRSYLFNYQNALAIYNKYAGIIDDPFVPYELMRELPERFSKIVKRKNHGRVFGIDLGTTYSAITTLDDNGMPVVIPNNEESSDLLASAVYFQDGADPVVGEIAKNQKGFEPDKVVEFVKRYIGRPDAPKYEFDGVVYNPITISALILKRMKEYAEAQGYEVNDVVITCPSYFGLEDKVATKQAGEIAGLNVLNIVHEPTAAALHYYYAGEFKENRRIMVYDLGGGTFDITLFDFSVDENGKALIAVIRTGGDDRLGGIDWDDRLFNYICELYAGENGLDLGWLENDLKAVIRKEVESTKKQLSSLPTKKLTIAYDGDLTRVTVTREEFENRTQDLVQRTMDYVTRLLSDSNLTANDVDVVLLVGGSTFMPMIKNSVEALFPGKVRFEQPNLAVAKGAALSAAIEWEETLYYIERTDEELGYIYYPGVVY